MKMTWLSVVVLLMAALLPSSLAAICPESCICSTTRDGLHRASCSNLAELQKFTLQRKHHNINILDLSHNNITKLTHELDRLTEVVMLDLSNNGIVILNKFLSNANKLVHLNLANNRIENLSVTNLPKSISSIDLTNNLLKNLPFNIEHLKHLEHLEIEGNPIDCSCENLVVRDNLLASNVVIDNVKCVQPIHLKNRPWLELKRKDICKVQHMDINLLDMMMGDQNVDAVSIGAESTALKSMPLTASNDLEDGKVLQGPSIVDEDDSIIYVKPGSTSQPSEADLEGSGNDDSTTASDILIQQDLETKEGSKNEQLIMAEQDTATIDPIDGSGEGSGFGIIESRSFGLDEREPSLETTTQRIEDLVPPPVQKIFEDEDGHTIATEYPEAVHPTVYSGGVNWHMESTTTAFTTTTTTTTEKPIIFPVTPDTTVSEQIRVTQASEILGSSEQDGPTHKTGTYICIAIIVVLLVGLIAFAIVKGQMRKRRDRRILRQQKVDVETASKEMVDMNKSLLGKPAVIDGPVEKKVNGRYELVPTHESHQKKNDNGDLGNGVKHKDTTNARTGSPRDTNQNKNSSKDNNLNEQGKPQIYDTSFGSTIGSGDSRKDNMSLSSTDMFAPLNDYDSVNPLNGNQDLDVSQPLINGDHKSSDFLAPPNIYQPVYPQDAGRVRIKLAETPKPKTPVLVTRSRSNAGDIIITPTVEDEALKSTT